MKIDILDILGKNLRRTIIIIVILTPSIWWFTSLYYHGRIEVLKEKEDLLKQQIQFLESKMKVSPQFPIESSPTTLTDTTKQTPLLSSSEELKTRYPHITDSKKLTKKQVKELAMFYNLLNEWKINPHLKFKEGDISYWYEQSLSEDVLKREFDSRRIVLERSEVTGEVIETQGDLSYMAEEIQDQMQSR